MFKNYFKTAFRNLRRNKVYSIINILGLSLGLACGMLIILYVKDEVSYDRFHKNEAQIYRISTDRVKPDGSRNEKSGITGIIHGAKFAAGVPDIREFVRILTSRKDIKTGTEVVSQDMHKVDANFFQVFSFPLLQGDPNTALKDPHSIVITEEVARKQFGTTDAMGKFLSIKEEGDKFIPYKVTGIAKNCPQNSSLKFEALLPLVVSQEDITFNENWFNFFINTFVVLQPGADVKAVEAKMKKVYESDARDVIKMMAEKYGDDAVTTYRLQPLSALHLDTTYTAGNGLTDASNPMYSYILSGIAMFILLIACINFVNLTVARSVKRAKEIGIRKVVGGDRSQLIFQFLGESFLLCLLAFVLAVVLVQLSLPVFNDLANKALAISYLFDVKLIAGYVVLFLATSLLAGFYPALVLSSYNPVKVLYSRFTLSGKNYLQKGLVIVQFTLASFLIIGTITVWSQFDYLTKQELGYDDTNLASVSVNGKNIDRLQAQVIREELLKSPAIAEVSLKNNGSWATGARINDKTEIFFAFETIDDGYLPMLKIPVIKGRNFSKAFPADSTHSVLVNEAFVAQAGWSAPIGKEVDFWYNPGEKYTVIGVVKDHHYEALTQKIGPQLFTMKPGNGYGKVFMKVKPQQATAGLQHIEKVFKRLYPYNPFAYTFQDELNRKNYEAEARWKSIMLFGAGLTIFVSCIGLFGLSVFSAEKRRKEIGIRKVLGASVSGVVTILSKDFLKLVLASLLIAIPIAWLAASKWLESYPYRIALSWWMFGIAGIIVALVAVTTVGFHAVKAAMANPVKSLRTE